MRLKSLAPQSLNPLFHTAPHFLLDKHAMRRCIVALAYGENSSANDYATGLPALRQQVVPAETGRAADLREVPVALLEQAPQDQEGSLGVWRKPSNPPPDCIPRPVLQNICNGTACALPDVRRACSMFRTQEYPQGQRRNLLPFLYHSIA